MGKGRTSLQPRTLADRANVQPTTGCPVRIAGQLSPQPTQAERGAKVQAQVCSCEDSSRMSCKSDLDKRYDMEQTA